MIDSERCPECCVVAPEHELWCSHAPETLTLGSLRELLTQLIELDGVHESKRVAFVMTDPHQTLRAIESCGLQYLRGEFVLALRERVTKD